MRFSRALAVAVLCSGALATAAMKTAGATNEEQALLRVDGAVFGPAAPVGKMDGQNLDPNFSWTDASGNTLDKPAILQRLASGKGLRRDASESGQGDKAGNGSLRARVYGPIGVVQANTGRLYVLRVWVKRGAGWRLLIYHAVSTGSKPSGAGESGTEACENPCRTVPFQPHSEGEREVIATYQAVERAVEAHDSAAWGAHIAEEFFAVTSNSDRPLDKATRMAGLDSQKVAGIPPFPLASAHMYQFGEAMVMTSTQQPDHGLPLHVTRVWFRRHGAWLEAYSYQTTIQAGAANP